MSHDVVSMAWARFDEVGEYDSYMAPVEDGDYVLYEDAQSTVAALQARIDDLEALLKRTKGSSGQLSKLIRDCKRFIKDPSDKYAALAREDLLKKIKAIEATK